MPVDHTPNLAVLRERLASRAASFVGEVAHQSGLAEVWDPITNSTRPLETRVRLARGCRVSVRTGTLLVRFEDGSDVWLSAGSELELGGWDLAARRLKLAAGKALALVARESKRLFEVETDIATIAVTGTAFEVDCGSASARISVLHGSIEVRSAQGAAVSAAAGRAVQAARGTAPVVTPLTGRPGNWLDGIEQSRGNRAIHPAFRAASRHLGGPLLSTKETDSMVKYVTAAVAAIVILGGVFWAMSGGTEGAPSTSVPVSNTAALPAAQGNSAGPSWSAAEGEPTQEVTERRIAKIRIGDQEIEFDPKDAESLEAALSNVPEDKREQVRLMLKPMVEGNGLPSLGGVLGKGDEDMLQREAGNAAAIMKDLIAQGMSPKEAAKVVSQGVTDSVQKQIGDKAKVSVNMLPSEGGEGTKQRIGLFIGADSDAKLPPPGEGVFVPAPTPTPKQ